MTLPFYPATEPRDFGDVIMSEAVPYIARDAKTIQLAAFYAIAIQRSVEDAADLLEPQLPPEARPYVELFERFLLHRAEHYMARWTAPPSTNEGPGGS
jgi:hypothetical protein